MSGWTDTTPDCACPRCRGCQKMLHRDAEGELCEKCQEAYDKDIVEQELEEWQEDRE